MKFRAFLTLLAAAIIAFGIHLMRGKGAPEIATAPVPENIRVEEQMRAAIELPAESEAIRPVQENDAPRVGPAIQLARGQLAWEARIESVTSAGDLSETAKSRGLLAMLTALPEQGLASAAEEAANRLPDADYNAVALPVVANPQTHGLALSVLFADLMERPDAIALPALLRIARIPNHPYAKFARDNLDLLVGEDFGADWLKWEAAVRKTLAAEK